MLSVESFAHWLSRYGRAWETGDPTAVVALFTDDARYYETPFDPPLEGLAAIRQYWSEGAEQTQRQVQFSFTVKAVTDSVGLAHWCASFHRVPSGQVVALDGMLEADFTPDGRCRCFREWWHRRESAP